MEIVVVGVDGSETAAKAAGRAAALAAGLGGSLVVVNAFEASGGQPHDYPSDLPPFSVHDSAEAIARQAVDVLRRDFPDLEMSAQAELGKPAEVLVGLAEKLSASVIVVGNKRVQGIARVLGSIARDVAQHAPCDVFVVHTVAR